MNDESQVFKSGAIRPMECLSEAWQLIKTDYLFFLGVSFVGLLIAGMAQLILMGPMMCGIYLVFLHRMSERPANFNTLFKGFDFFLPSFIAVLIMTVPAFILIFGLNIAMVVAMISLMAAQGGAPGPGFPFLLFGLIGLFVFANIVINAVLHALFMFVFPLIIDRGLSGWEAVKLSFRAVLANLGGVLLVMLLTTALSILGLLLCYVGAILELPLTMAMTMVAYRQVFPEINRLREYDMIESEPELEAPLPAQEGAPSSTDYHDREPGRGP